MVWAILSLGQHFRQRQYGLNHIVFSSKRSKKTKWVEPYCLLVKIFLKDNMGQTILSFDQNLQSLLEWSENATQIEKNHYKDNMDQIVLLLLQFLKFIWNKKWNFIKTLYWRSGSNRIVRIISWLEFARNIAKFNIDWTICDFDKHWSKFTKWTIWINPYCPLLKILQKYFNI